jgi:hypothetical protein
VWHQGSLQWRVAQKPPTQYSTAAKLWASHLRESLAPHLLALGLGALAVIRNKWIHMVAAIVMLLGILSGVPFVIFN